MVFHRLSVLAVGDSIQHVKLEIDYSGWTYMITCNVCELGAEGFTNGHVCS